MNERKFYVQRTGGSGENSSALEALAESSTVVPVALIRAKLHSCPVTELPAPISMASHPDREFERQIGDDSRNTVDSNTPGQLEVMDKGSHPVVMSSGNTSVSGDPFHRHQ